MPNPPLLVAACEGCAGLAPFLAADSFLRGKQLLASWLVFPSTIWKQVAVPKLVRPFAQRDRAAQSGHWSRQKT